MSELGQRLNKYGDHVPEVPSFVLCCTMVAFDSIRLTETLEQMPNM